MNTSAKKHQSPTSRKKITYAPGPLPVTGFVRLPSVLAVLPISKTAFYDGIKAGKYPPGTLLTPRCRAWTAAEVRQILADLGCAQ